MSAEQLVRQILCLTHGPTETDAVCKIRSIQTARRIQKGRTPFWGQARAGWADARRAPPPPVQTRMRSARGPPGSWQAASAVYGLGARNQACHPCFEADSVYYGQRTATGWPAPELGVNGGVSRTLLGGASAPRLRQEPAARSLAKLFYRLRCLHSSCGMRCQAGPHQSWTTTATSAN